MRKTIVLGLTLANTLYVGLGGVIFSLLENKSQQETRTLREMFKNALGNRSYFSDDDMDLLVADILQACQEGSVTVNSSLLTPDWSIPNGILFAISGITTIGYGHITPKTTGGQLFCCIYLLIGIPLLALLLAGLGGNLSEVIKERICKFVWISFCPLVDYCAKMIAINSTMLVLIVLLPAILFSYMENWTYGEAVYFAITSLTTAGFGDYYFDQREGRMVYKFFNGCWIIMGLAVNATIISETISFFSIDKACLMNQKKRNKIRTVSPMEIKAVEQR